MNERMNNQRIRFEYLDGIRGLLAIFVALSHIYGAITGYASGRPFEGAYLAVDMFFVMSGFVLSYSLKIQKEKWVIFLLKRLARLWPLHVLGIFLVLLVLHLNELRHQYVPDYWGVIDFGLILKNILFLENMGLGDAIVINDPSWSISIEFWVGISILYLLVGVGRKWIALLMSLLVYFFIALKTGGGLSVNGNVVNGINLGLLRGVAGIALGVFLSDFNLSRAANKIKGNLIVSFGCLFIFLCIYWDGFYLDLVAVLLFALLVILMRDQNLLVAKIFEVKILAWLGERSFSIYLLHTPIILLIGPAAYLDYFNAHLIAAAVLMAVLIFSWGVYYIYEKPSRLVLYSGIEILKKILKGLE